MKSTLAERSYVRPPTGEALLTKRPPVGVIPPGSGASGYPPNGRDTARTPLRRKRRAARKPKPSGTFSITGQHYRCVGFDRYTAAGGREVELVRLATICPDCNDAFETKATWAGIQSLQLARRCSECVMPGVPVDPTSREASPRQRKAKRRAAQKQFGPGWKTRLRRGFERAERERRAIAKGRPTAPSIGVAYHPDHGPVFLLTRPRTTGSLRVRVVRTGKEATAYNTYLTNVAWGSTDIVDTFL